MSNLFRVTARGKWLASVPSVKPQGIVGSPFPNGDYLAPDREAIRAALPHYWRKAFDRSSLSQYSRQTCEFGSEGVFYRLYSSLNRPLVTIYCEPYEMQAEVSQ